MLAGNQVMETQEMTTEPLFDPDVLESPHGYFAELRHHDPVHQIDGTEAYLVTRLDLIKEVVADPQRFSSRTGEFLHLDADERPGLRPTIGEPDRDEDAFGILATADPPDHARHRAILGPILSTGAIRSREDEFRRLIDDALEPALRSGRVDWMSEVAEPLPMLMVTRLLGIADADAPILKEQGYAAVELISGFVPDDRMAALHAKLVELGPAIHAFNEACSSSQPDETTIIGACAHAHTSGGLDDLEAFGILATVLAAGGESTTSLLGAGVRLLAEDRELQDRLRAEPRLVATFVEEACRIEPPFRGHYRRVTADTTLGGTDLPAGSRLVLVWPAANRSDELGGDHIDIDRLHPRQHVGFGWGIHLCVGAPLARMEARVAFERLLSSTRSFSLAPEAHLRHHRSLMVRRLESLPLLLES